MKENKLKFTGEELPPKTPPGKPKSAVRDLPKELTQAAVRNAVREYADDNAGTDAAVSLTGAAETSGRILENAVRNEQIRQQRKANTESLKEDGSLRPHLHPVRPPSRRMDACRRAGHPRSAL